MTGRASVEAGNPVPVMDRVWPPPREPVAGVKLVTARVYVTVAADEKLADPNGETFS